MINLRSRATHLHLHHYANASSSRIRAISPHTMTGRRSMMTLLRRRSPSPSFRQNRSTPLRCSSFDTRMFAKARSSVLQITTIYSLPSTLQRYFCHDRPTTQNAVAPLPPPTATQAPALTQDAANRRNACNILSTRRYELLPKCSTSSCEPSATIRYCIFTSGFLMCTSARDTAGPQDRRGAGVLSDANVAV